MKGKVTSLFVALASVAVLFAPTAVQATYTTIAHNLLDGSSDTEFNATTKALTASSHSPRLTLNDPGALEGTATNVTVNLTTTLANYNPATGDALFTGGDFLLTFDFGGGTGYSIGGPIDGMVLTVNTGTPSLSTISGEGLFTATSKNLPGSGNWPDGGGKSSIKSLTLAFGVDLTGFAWDETIGGSVNRMETSYTLFPNGSAAPEPASCLLLLVGSAFLARRRHA